MDAAAESPGDTAALAVALASKMAETGGAVATDPAQKSSLIDSANKPRLKNPKGGAKFVTAP